MSGPLRSKQGCWTCRLRKKKCDEGRPLCSTCQSLSITCYGYGAKPDWMDNGEKEKAISNSLKEIVKHTSRRKVTNQISRQRDSTTRLAPKILNGSLGYLSSGHELNHPSSADTPTESNQNLAQDDITQYGSDNLKSSGSSSGDISRSTFSPAADESVLLMHFLDVVFPLQYPMYKPNAQEGGRGWLLTILLQTEPLYHVALALSAYHRRATLVGNVSSPPRIAALVQQESHLETCVKLIKEAAQNSCPNKGLGILTSLVQLAFYELCTGDGNTWQVHLHAAIHMYQIDHAKSLASFNLATRSSTILWGNLPLLDQEEPVVVEEVTNFRFLAGTIFWLDIISSITSGTAPRLFPNHVTAIATDSQINIEDIMGCKNWVMLQIGRIASFHEVKIQALEMGDFDCTEFKRTVDDIDGAIQCSLTQGVLEDFKISDPDSATVYGTTSDPSTLITHIFTYMACLYLHVVIHGFQRLHGIDATISEAMRVLETPLLAQILPVIVSPLYIIGTFARHEDEQFFRDIFSSPALLSPLFEHRGKILPILEEIWRRRDITPNFTWKDSLQLTDGVLLV